MNQTVVGVFNSYEAAEQAAAELTRQGFERDAMQIKATGTTSSASSAGTTTAQDHEGTGFMTSVRHFFAELFGDEEEHAGNYTEAVRRGGAVLTVEADENRIDVAREALTGAGAIDIDEHVSTWRSQGWSGHDSGAAPNTQEQAASDRQNVVPVVQEELAVGKRQVSGGAVRVVSRVVSRPVSESVELRREEAVVERRPVDRELTSADAAAFQERTVEVQEMAERPVVQKTARVVEEVVVGTRVSTETQQVEDTVRSTEVNVERVGGDAERGIAEPATSMQGQGSMLGGQGQGSMVDQGQGSTLGQGEGSTLGGQGQGSMLGGQGQGSMVGQGEGSMLGQGEGSMLGQGEGSTLGQGQGSMLGQNQGSMAGQTQGFGEGQHQVGATSVLSGGSGSTQQSTGAGMVGAVSGNAAGRRGFSDVEDEFRQDYQTNFAGSGGSYDEFQPAYRGGYELRSDSRYANRDWNDIEPEVRSRWESENPGSAWDRVKSAVRRGWERATT